LAVVGKGALMLSAAARGSRVSPVPGSDTSGGSPGVVRAPLLRLGFVGRRGPEWLGGAEDDATLGADGAPDAPPPDVVVIDPDPDGRDRAAVARLAEQARADGARVVGIAAGTAGEPVWRGLVDLRLGHDAGDDPAPLLAVPPAVDPAELNPLDFRPADVAGVALLQTDPRADPRRALELVAPSAADEPVVLYTPRSAATPPTLPPGVSVSERRPRAPAAVARAFQAHLGAVDHPALHRNPLTRATWLVRLAAAGVPTVAVELDQETEALLGAELSAALLATSLADLADLDQRERVSSAQRRPAHREHSQGARRRALAETLGFEPPPRPLVSVVLATRRESWLRHGVEQVSRQNYEPRELVVVLHGDGFSDGVEGNLRDWWDGPLEVVRADSDLTLGDVLNAGVEAARGEYVTKMDDDDYYSVDHLWDLAIALEYSDADLVGKAAEFVYLEEIDVTVRQLTGAVETRLAGGGMMARRSALAAVGAWPSLPRNEDRALVARFEEAGRRVHRIPPHGYILNRHGQDHTWRPYTDYFLFRSGRQWRGLRFDQTGIA
jgi:hypothetical protein